MPFYKFQDLETSEIVEKFLNISQYEVFKEQNPHLQPVIGAPMMMDPVRAGVTKRDSGFTEVLNRIHSRSPGSDMKKNNII